MLRVVHEQRAFRRICVAVRMAPDAHTAKSTPDATGARWGERWLAWCKAERWDVGSMATPHHASIVPISLPTILQPPRVRRIVIWLPNGRMRHRVGGLFPALGAADPSPRQLDVQASENQDTAERSRARPGCAQRGARCLQLADLPRMRKRQRDVPSWRGLRVRSLWSCRSC